MASKKARKGKRYSDEEKQAVVDFVNEHNASNGRGGVTEASKKFGASSLSITSWMKGRRSAGNSGKTEAKTEKAGEGKRSKVLAELSKLDHEITTRRKELERLESKFEKLKRSL